MAAAHIFIVPTDAIESYETGGSRHELVTHAHAYATELAPIDYRKPLRRATSAGVRGLVEDKVADGSYAPTIRAQPLLADQAAR